MAEFIKVTEQSSLYDNLEQMSVTELLTNLNNEDQKVAIAVRESIPVMAALVEKIVERMEKGGRVFYIGAGTSGRLGVLDASELPPTYGVSPDLVIGLIAGGDKALRSAVESAEDDAHKAWNELKEFDVNELDTLIGIAASGTTPYKVSFSYLAQHIVQRNFIKSANDFHHHDRRRQNCGTAQEGLFF